MDDAQADTSILAPLRELSVFAGHWVGDGTGHYPTVEDFAYDEEIELLASGKPFLAYRSRTREAGTGRPMHTETGYLRMTSDGVTELLVAQPTGYVEIHRGEVREGVLDLSMLTLSASPEAKPVHAIRRHFTVVDDTLIYDLWMAHDRTPLTHHLHAELHRS